MADKQPQREKTGILFKNKDPKSERSPEYTGECTIDGKELRIAAWIKEGKSGKFMSLQFSEPQQQSGGGTPRDSTSESAFF
jgi:hypothetical protein